MQSVSLIRLHQKQMGLICYYEPYSMLVRSYKTTCLTRLMDEERTAAPGLV